MTELPALSIEGLGHAFGSRRVLSNVSFSLAPGDFTVLLGLNGAGKTTLFSLATRLYVQREGVIRIFGMDIRERASECLRRMGVVFQQPTLDLDLTVEQNLFYHASLHGLSHREAAERSAAEIERVGLAGQRRDKVRQLSGGQRRRVEIAAVSCTAPACCCSTSQRSGSTSPAGNSCSTTCADCAARKTSPPSGPRI